MIQKNFKFYLATAAILIAAFLLWPKVTDNSRSDFVPVTGVDYRSGLELVFGTGWQDEQIEDVRKRLLDLVVPSEFRNLHLELTLALGRAEQAQKNENAADISEHISKINTLLSE
ncbi:hypothetical protein CL622_07105 [archaeon]|nr:hypothetical protein [archaeon]|tara:strand:- start:226 stop:570 length:345 start_codon:yes stop_codon:yes gene_type:complete